MYMLYNIVNHLQMKCRLYDTSPLNIPKNKDIHKPNHNTTATLKKCNIDI